MKRFLIGTALAVPLGLWLWGTVIGPALAQCPGVNCTTPVAISIPVDGIRNTYGAAARAFVPAAAATDVATLCGTSAKTIRVTAVTFSGRATTEVNGDVTIVKRSAANSGGTSASLTAVPYSNAFGAAVAAAASYTANPTLGTSVGSLSTRQYYFGNLTSARGAPDIVWTFGDRPASAVILRSSGQCLTVNLNQATYSGGLVNVSFEWTEE